MNISLGYFTYDMLCCLYIDLDFANVAHHLCTMLGLAVGVCNGVVSCSCGAVLVMHIIQAQCPHTKMLCRAEQS